MRNLTRLLLSTLLALTLVLSVALPLPLAPKAQAHTLGAVTVAPDLYEQTEWTDLGGNKFRVSLKVHFINSGPAVTNVVATVTYRAANQDVTDGVVTVPAIAAGGGAWSVDTFTFILDLNNPTDPRDGSQWRVEYTDANGVRQTELYVPKFIGEHAHIGNFVWEDRNKNGLQDTGEPGVDGVTVNVYAAWDLSLVGTTTTANGGIWGFVVTAPGKYYVQFVPGNGWWFTSRDVGTNDEIDSDANPNTGSDFGKTVEFIVYNGTTDLSWDAGIWNQFTHEFKPNTAVGISASPNLVHIGDTVTLTVTEQNTGDFPLTSPRVDVDNGVGSLAAPPTSGDTNGNGVLDLGETWSWTRIVTIADTTTFIALGHGFYLGNDISFANGYLTEKAEVPVRVIKPDTLIDIISTPAGPVTAGSKVTLTVTERNTGDVPLTNPRVDVDKGIGSLTRTSSNFTGGDTSNTGVLDPGETWTWTIANVTIADTTTFTTTGHGTDPLGRDITYPQYAGERAQVTVTAIFPGTMLTLTASPNPLPAGSKTTLTITETNTGAVPLTSANVTLSPPGVTLTKDSAGFSGDTNTNGVLDPNETWQWVIPNVVIWSTTTFVGIGHGTDPNGNDVTYPAYPGERAEVTVTVSGGLATRTPGFWKTHLQFTTWVFNNRLGSHMDIGWKDIYNIPNLMGIFWASNTRNSDGSRRSALSQARETTAFQVVAAILNTGLDNGKPMPVTLAQIQAIMSGTDIAAIRALGKTLDAYNNSGDEVPIVSPVPIGNAKPKEAKAIANIPFADSP